MRVKVRRRYVRLDREQIRKMKAAQQSRESEEPMQIRPEHKRLRCSVCNGHLGGKHHRLMCMREAG